MRLAAALVGLLAPALSMGCGGGERAATGPDMRRAALEYPVEVVPAPAGNVEYRVTAVGSVEAFEKVQITARVPGAVDAVRFQEGDSVRDGQVLVEIDRDRYRLAVERAEAALAKAEASRADAEAGLARREGAKATGIFPAEDVETFRTRLRVAEAETEQARAALEQARLDLRDASVRAPMAGIVETRSVQTGQYVQPGSTLGSMVRREPLLVRLTVPEGEAGSLSAGMRATVTVTGDEQTYSVVLTHVAGAADEATRMVAVTGRIDDRGRGALRPGAFAQVTIPVGEASAAPVIPQTAVRPSERGFLAYVVEGDVARERVLTLGMRTARGEVEVRSGLSVGEPVVVRGAEALRDGVRVKVEGPR